MNLFRKKRSPDANKYAAVLVFGDIGRSPRMQNHAYELATMTDYNVYLVGFQENKPYEKIASNEKITIVDISSSLVDKLRKLPKILYLIYAVLRVFIQMLQLFYIFIFKLQRPDFVIVQNPPSIPVLSSMFLICKLINMKLVIDFHNYGYTLLALNVKAKPLVALATKYEKMFAKSLDYGLCVSNAMRIDLKENWGIDTTVVYDKPNTAIFKPINLEEKHDLFKKLGLIPRKQKSPEDTLFTTKQGNKVTMREGRPMLLVSSTSWTKDEDFGILFEAMEAYEEEGQKREKVTDRINLVGSYPHLHLVITGKGPEKERYLRMIEEKKLNWKFITIETKWLEANDYPKLLAAADLGICLHYSSSGVDLPMKVVDMFGSVLPVAAIDYKCIDELVKHSETGYVFKDSKELASLLKETFGDYPSGIKEFERFKVNIEKFRARSFDDEWRDNVLPIVQKIDVSAKKEN